MKYHFISVFLILVTSHPAEAFFSGPDMRDLEVRKRIPYEYCASALSGQFTACASDLTEARNDVCDQVAAYKTQNSPNTETLRSFNYWCEGRPGSGDMKYTFERRMRHWTGDGYIYKWHSAQGSTWAHISTEHDQFKYHYVCPPEDERFAEHTFPVEKDGGLWCAPACKSPFTSDGTSCFTYCPANASKFDFDLGRCIPNDVEKQCADMVGNPISAATGEKTQKGFIDFQGGGSFTLTLERSYESFRHSLANNRHDSLSETELGTWVKYEQPRNWSGGIKPSRSFYQLDTEGEKIIPATGYLQWHHNYQNSLIFYRLNTKAYLSRWDGPEIYFKKSNDTTLEATNLLDAKLTLEDEKWNYINQEGHTEAYNLQGQLVSITNQHGQKHTLAYNANGMLTSVTDDANRKITFMYDDNGRLITAIEPSGKKIHYKYDAVGNLSSVSLPDETSEDTTDNPQYLYSYDNANHPYALTKQTDENGDIKTTWTYDDSGRATSSTNNNGHKATFIVYEENTATITEGNAHERVLTFDNKGRLSSVTGGNCGQCGNSDVASYQYNSKNQLISETDFNGVVTTYQYNNGGKLAWKIEAAGTPLARYTNMKWHSSYDLPTRITSPTLQTDYVYGLRGRLESITETDLTDSESPTRVTTYTYNELGLLTSIDGPRSDVTDTTTFTYDANHDLKSVTDAAGNTTTITARNANGYPTSITDANGISTTLSYDVRNRLLSQTINGVHTTQFTYDNVGQLTQVTLPSGAVTQYTYNGARLLTAIEDGLGNRVEYTHDVMGNVTQVDVKDAEGSLFATQQQVFDGLNRLTSQIDGLNNTTRFAYDAVGNQVSVNTPLLKETKQVYDALNRLTETIDAKANKTTYSYDVANNLTSVKAANEALTTYSYDGFGNLLSQSSPDTGTTNFTYDVAGNQITKTDAKGTTVNYSYDALNRLTSIDYTNDNLDVTLAYDTGTNGKGRLSQITDGSGTTQYSYDVLGNITGKTTTISGKSFTVNYAYNGDNQLTQLTLPSGRAVNLTRNTHGLITDITEAKAGTTQTLLTSANYVPFGQAKNFSLGNGKTMTRAHNLNAQLTEITVNGVYQSSIGYNSDSTITALTSALNPTSNQTYNYDELDRLTGAMGSYGPMAYSYDSVSNRITKIDNGTENSINYLTQSNQLASPFLHDVNGNRTRDAKRSYSYGKHNRLTEVISDEDGIKTLYLYNGLGQRVKKSNVFGDIYFLYDEQGLLIAEANGEGTITKEYVYFEGQPLVMMVGE